MIEELETMTANLKKAQGLVTDTQIAADKLPTSEAVNDLRDSLDAALSEIAWALDYIKAVASEAQP